MDTALTLRLNFEKKQSLLMPEVDQLHKQSDLLKKLTTDFLEQPLFAVFRLLGLSEVPYAERLPYTQKLLDYTKQNLATSEGFSCLGGVSQIVPCYNAMLLESYSRLGLAESEPAQAAVRWINQYQLFERGQKTSWPHNGICKHGGCLGAVPCYIGIGKTVRALLTYTEFSKQTDPEIEQKIGQGIEYMLRHKMYQRLSNQKPISKHITDIMMPQNYALSLTDLVYIVGKAKLARHPQTADLMSLLKQKQVGENQWKISYIYSYRGYVAFENRRKVSQWVSNLFGLWLAE